MFSNIIIQGIFYVLLAYVIQLVLKKIAPKPSKDDRPKLQVVGAKEEEIEPERRNFNYLTNPPHKFRPWFPGKYPFGLGMFKISKLGWLIINSEYKERLALRAKVVSTHENEVILFQKSPATKEAVYELYDRIISFYLKRYPMCFKKTGNAVVNLITGKEIPETASGHPKEVLHLIAANCVEDFWLLGYNERKNAYLVKAAVLPSANRLDPVSRLNMPLTDNASPLATYSKDYQGAMHRLLQKVEEPLLLQKLDWWFQRGFELYRPQDDWTGDLNFESDVIMRVERQLLSKLPQSKYAVLTVGTYLTPAAELKQEGRGEDIIKAVRGLTPEVAEHKRANLWGEAVIRYFESRVE